ncbi:S-methyl-5-thioribose-1-phosphate isomerase [Alkalicoccus daliensis]|uniref:Methylthioribose-1-phosphate isomerase n=1 Tax=Alkalicoccus daliensis TaxID=745820 RepID=A0A1H0HBV5_9BACI|nr:S-methyl-5-thioribose-1-phosphate isomerase [Alkalicoccus daliensis]SDO16608.1 methylthioribose-1-phosphate isomerase [Alkalicoccus daliensis]
MEGLIIQSVKLEDSRNVLVILDQSVLPETEKYLDLITVEDVWEAIYELKVRGAPAIGIAAAYGVYLAVKQENETDRDAFTKAFAKAKNYLASSRPTAVNLFWALERMEKRLHEAFADGLSVPEVKQQLKKEADKIRNEDEEVCKTIGEHALTLLKPGMGILTHCNAGTIATAKYGTALAPLYLGHQQDYQFKVFTDETRPLLQGARLTAWELQKAGIDVTLICDNMASIVMKENKIEAVLVGCDRVAANGDTANKIGTSSVAIMAKHYGIPFYVCAPISTIDLACETGENIEIEQRSLEEVTEKWYSERMAPKDVKVYNPAFDVTDHSLITAIVTEKGIAYPGYQESLHELFHK